MCELPCREEPCGCVRVVFRQDMSVTVGVAVGTKGFAYGDGARLIELTCHNRGDGWVNEGRRGGVSERGWMRVGVRG